MKQVMKIDWSQVPRNDKHEVIGTLQGAATADTTRLEVKYEKLLSKKIENLSKEHATQKKVDQATIQNLRKALGEAPSTDEKAKKVAEISNLKTQICIKHCEVLEKEQSIKKLQAQIDVLQPQIAGISEKDKEIAGLRTQINSKEAEMLKEKTFGKQLQAQIAQLQQ